MTKIYWTKSEPLKDLPNYEKAYSLLNDTRKAKADRIVKDESRFNSVAAWTLLAHALKQEGITLNEEEVAHGPFGKPSLVSKKTHFNLSHAGNGVIVCAVSSESVGVDVEEIKKQDLAIAKRYFAAKEYGVLKKSKDPDRLFTELWTMKESLLKRLGTGLSSPLDAYDFSEFIGKDRFDAFGSTFTLFEVEANVIGVSSLGCVDSLTNVSLIDIIR